MWFAAKLEFESEVDGVVPSRRLLEESIRVIEVKEETDAMEAARSIGRRDEHEYYNEDGALVKWQFVRVIEIQDLAESELTHGTEVWSEIIWRE